MRKPAQAHRTEILPRLLRVRKRQAFLIHGTADWKIPWSSSQQLHAAAPCHSRLILVKNAGHDSVMAEIQRSLEAEVLAWFRDPSED